VVNIVSERDLFALQRLSLKQVSTRSAPRRTRTRCCTGGGGHPPLCAQPAGPGRAGAPAHRADQPPQRRAGRACCYELLARSTGWTWRGCWLAFGSEGRSEQTIATDQDNGLLHDPAADRPAWLALAREVNEALDACGYPLCKGNVMASNPACCLTARMARTLCDWIDHGAPRTCSTPASTSTCARWPAPPATGLDRCKRHHRGAKRRAHAALHEADGDERAAQHARADLGRRSIDTSPTGGQQVDLKLHGTAICLWTPRACTPGPRRRGHVHPRALAAAAQAMGVPAQESEAWIAGFEVLQLLRLQVQLERGREAVDAPDGNPNLVDVPALNDIDRRVLKESLRVARRLQQRIQLDYLR
jgi:CBS domain-containing protein